MSTYKRVDVDASDATQLLRISSMKSHDKVAKWFNTNIYCKQHAEADLQSVPNISIPCAGGFMQLLQLSDANPVWKQTNDYVDEHHIQKSCAFC